MSAWLDEVMDPPIPVAEGPIDGIIDAPYTSPYRTAPPNKPEGDHDERPRAHR